MTTIEAYKIDNSFGHYYDFLDIDEEELLYLPLDTRVDQAFHQYFTPSVTSFVKTNLHVAVPEAHEEKAELVDKLEAALDGVQTAVEWSEYVKTLEHFYEVANHYLQEFSPALQAIILATEVKKFALGILHKDQELAESPSKIAKLGFSIVSRISKILTGLQNLGLLTPAAAAILRLTIVGALCVFISSLIDLGSNVFHFTSVVKLLVAALKFAVASLVLYLALHSSTALTIGLTILSLIITTCTLFLSATTGTY